MIKVDDDTVEPGKEENKDKRLKFRSEIDNLKLSISCPESLFPISEDLEAFRFCHNPLDISIDFLPNVVYDRIIGMPYDYSSDNKNETAKCNRCGASFFTKLDGLLTRWNNLNEAIKEQFGYVSVAKGILTQTDGEITKINTKGHFGFYEYDGSTFHNSFKISQHLP